MTENEKLLSDLLLARDELSRVVATGSVTAIDAVKPKSDALCAAVLARMAGPGECQWTYDADTESWDTGCGEKFHFETDGPTENGQKFCGYCGEKLAEVRPAPEPDEYEDDVAPQDNA